jgi:CheY-like chemotaxis protein
VLSASCGARNEILRLASAYFAKAELPSSEGYEVVVFATGAQLLEAVPTFHPDVIVVDMMMPGLSGTDVLAALRRAGLAVPVILISAHPITEPEGFLAFIKKPFNLVAMRWSAPSVCHLPRSSTMG